MLKTCSTVAALALIAVLAAPADAQSPRHGRRRAC